MSTLGDIIEYTGGYHEYTGECSVQWVDTMSKLGVFSTLGDTMSVGDIMSTPGDVQYIGVSIQIQLFFSNDLPPHLS